MQTLRGAKYLWKLPHTDHQQLLEIASSYNLSFPIAQTLLARGLTSREHIDSYLFSSSEKDVAHPSLMKDAEKAVDRILYAIKNKEKILVAGDYDVDGVTSSAMMLVCLLPLDAQINFFLPHRVKDGYGLSVKTIERAADSGYTVVITVDNGITAFEPALKAKERTIDLIITDHHKAHDHLPDAYAIVNPNQTDCSYPFKALAGVGVTFKLLSLLYEKLGKKMPSKAYELLLLGTIADVVPLTQENRFWVRHGLHYVNSLESPSLKVLKANGNVTKPKISSLDIGFSIAPQINALGRLEDARAAVKFLIGSELQEIEATGKILLELNQARKDIERSVLADIEATIAAGSIDPHKENIIIAGSSSWPSGVIGLVASRVVGMYGKPTFLFHMTKDGMAKGSGRSIPEFNLFKALSECKHLLKQFGGHAQAAGLSLPAKNIPALKEVLEQLISQQVSAQDLQQKITLDAHITMPDVTKKLLSDLEHLEPFGCENKQPLFLLNNVSLVQPPQLLKDAHIKCQVFADGIIKPLIFFGRPDLMPLLSQSDQTFSCAVHVVENYWNDRVNIELQGIDCSLEKLS